MGLKNFFKKSTKKKRKYEGASKTRRTSSWLTGNGDANTQIRGSLNTLRERSRDLRRNNPYAHKAIELITNNVIGTGILTQITGDNSPNGELEQAWKDWAYTPACDFDGRHDLKGLQRIVMDAIIESGEVLIRKRFVDGPFPIQYQILESDFLNDNLRNGVQTDGNLIMQGIEFDENGKRVGYHLHQSHPGSTAVPLSTHKSVLVPASEIYHLFRIERPGQVRGVPWLSPSMIRLFDLDGFEDATLMRQKISALFVAFIRDISADVECDDESDLGEKMSPGLIEHLPPGKSIEFADPPDPQNYKEFTSAHLRGIAAGLGISYEGLTGDLTEVNFSSARMGWIEMGRNFDSWRQHIITTPFLRPVEKDFVLMMALLGKDASGLKFTPIPPRREMIDPTKEIPALIAGVRGGFMSRSETITSMGKDADDVHAAIQKDNEKADELGLILDTDPRRVNKTGKAQDTGVVDEN